MLDIEKLKELVDALIKARKTKKELEGTKYMPASIDMVIASLERRIKRVVEGKGIL